MGSVQEVGDLGNVLSKLSMKSIPTWDPSNNNEKTIDSHLKAFENAIGGLNLDKEEQARELIASLRGQALSLVENLEDNDRKDYAVIKQALIEVFHKEKPLQVLIQEFYGMIWKKKKQTIREYATTLNLTWKKIAKNQQKGDKTSDAILKARLMDGIAAAEPKFGELLQFTTAAETDFNKLAIEAEYKYDTFKATRERVHEHEWEEEQSFFNKENFKERNRHRNSKSQTYEQDSNNENMNKVEAAHGQSNMFQDQRREHFDEGLNGRDQWWGPQPQYNGTEMNYQNQRQQNWKRPRYQDRWNAYDNRYNNEYVTRENRNDQQLNRIQKVCDQNNYFQDQSQPLNNGRGMNYYDERQPNWRQPQKQSRFYLNDREHNPHQDGYRHYLQPQQYYCNNQNNDERYHKQEFRGQFLQQDAWWNSEHHNDVGENYQRTNDDYHGESKLRQRKYHETSDVLQEKNKQEKTNKTKEKQTKTINQNEDHKNDHDEEDYWEYL